MSNKEFGSMGENANFVGGSFRGQELTPPLPARVINPLGIPSQPAPPRPPMPGERRVAASEANDKPPEEISSAKVTIRDKDRVLFTGGMTAVEWEGRSGPTRMLTSDPTVFSGMVTDGPAFFDTLDQGVSADVFSATEFHAYRLKYDGDARSIKIYPLRSYVDTSIEGVVQTVSTSTSASSRYNEPIDMVSRVQVDAVESPLYRANPAVAAVYDKLGFSVSDWGAVIPTPGRVEQTLRDFRERDTESGLYYPDLALLPAGEIDRQTYLQAYADGRHPVGANSFYHFPHDVANDHMVTIMTYGKSMMDMNRHYAEAQLARYGSELPENVTHPIDDFTGMSALYGLDEHETLVPEEMMRVLRDSGRVNSLQIVQWMKQQGMDTTILDAVALSKALRSEALSRFVTYGKRR